VTSSSQPETKNHKRQNKF